MDAKESSDPKVVENGSIQVTPEAKQTVTAPFLPAYTNTCSRTWIERTAFDFTWKIDQFCFIYKCVNSLHSPPFGLFGGKFQYVIKMGIEYDCQNIESLQFFLCTSTDYVGLCYITATHTLVKSLFTESISGRLSDKTLLIKIPSNEMPFGFEDNDTFTIQCHFDIIHRQVTNVINMTSSASTIFLKDVKSLENTSQDKFEDEESIKFIVGNEPYLVPKRMLCAINSSYFKNICLNYDVKEIDMTKLLEDNKPEHFKLLLSFIKTQNLKRDYYNLTNMLKIADKYDVLTLKLMCEHYLLKEITVKNVLELMQLAFLSNAKFLKTCLASFIKLHKSEIVNAKEFRDLPKQDANKIMELVEKSQMRQYVTEDILLAEACNKASNISFTEQIGFEKFREDFCFSMGGFSGLSCLVAIERDWFLLLEQLNPQRYTLENLVMLLNC